MPGETSPWAPDLIEIANSDANLYSRWRMSKDGSKFFYNFSDGNLPNELFMIQNSFKDAKQLTNLNPWIKNKKITRSELIKYRDSDVQAGSTGPQININIGGAQGQPTPLIDITPTSVDIQTGTGQVESNGSHPTPPGPPVVAT